MGWKALVAIKEARIAQLEAGLQLALRRLEAHEDAPLNSDLRQLFASTSETAVEPEKCCTCGHTLGHHNGGNGACTYSDPVGHCECRGFVVNRGGKP
jgi:hypothetical protein